jgi:hypothetical protein
LDLKGGVPFSPGSVWDFIGSRQFDITKLSDVFHNVKSVMEGRTGTGEISSDFSFELVLQTSLRVLGADAVSAPLKTHIEGDLKEGD